jgi:hypothetical protein
VWKGGLLLEKPTAQLTRLFRLPCFFLWKAAKSPNKEALRGVVAYTEQILQMENIKHNILFYGFHLPDLSDGITMQNSNQCFQHFHHFIRYIRLAKCKDGNNIN